MKATQEWKNGSKEDYKCNIVKIKSRLMSQPKCEKQFTMEFADL